MRWDAEIRDLANAMDDKLVRIVGGLWHGLVGRARTLDNQIIVQNDDGWELIGAQPHMLEICREQS